jgi:hypothetical protein
MNQARDLFAATLLASGKVLVSGGYDRVDAISGAGLYDPTAGAWVQTGGLIQPRYYHTATLLPDGDRRSPDPVDDSDPLGRHPVTPA